MTLQTSGAISMNNINVELGRSGTATIGLNQAESGAYGAINTASTSRPNGTTPNSINEWHGDVPVSVSSLTTKGDVLTQEEMLEVLSTEEWMKPILDKN